jgi:hypothetical protein
MAIPRASCLQLSRCTNWTLPSLMAQNMPCWLCCKPCVSENGIWEELHIHRMFESILVLFWRSVFNKYLFAYNFLRHSAALSYVVFDSSKFWILVPVTKYTFIMPDLFVLFVQRDKMDLEIVPVSFRLSLNLAGCVPVELAIMVQLNNIW